MLQSIDFSKSPIKPQLQICKNDFTKTTISSIPDAYQITQKASIGNISELEFNIFFKIEIHHEFLDNPNINKLKPLYLIKLIKGLEIEYYIIKSIVDNSDDNGDYKHVKCFSLGYELSFKKLYSYSVISYNASSVLNDILSETIWHIDYLYPEFNITYRKFDFNNISVLDALQQVAETFNAVIEYDTINRKISLNKLDAIGGNKGFSVSYGNILKNITYETDIMDLCTRMKAFGYNGMSINAVNPTGSNYVESYSSILYPFQRDINKVVLSHSDYISDSLANAILDYEELVDTKKNDYSTYLSQKTALQTQSTTEQNKITVMNTEMSIIEANLQTANSQDPPADTTALVVQKNAKQTEINAQNIVVTGIQNQIASIDSQITTLQNLLKVENNFTQNQMVDWNPYIIIRDFTNTNFTDAKELFDATKEEFLKVREPKIVVSISIINLLEVLEQQKNWYKINLGDTITIRHSILGINIQAKIIDVSFNYESSDITLIISNVKDLLTDEQRFIKDLYKSISTSTTVESSRNKWDNILPISDDVGNIFDILTGKVKSQVSLAINQNMTMTDKGLILRDLTDPNTYLVLQNGLLAITTDNGNTWKHAITKNGIVGERIYGKLLAGEKLLIETDSGIIRINGKNLTVFDADKISERVKLGDISDLQDGSLYGLKLTNDSGVVVISDGIVNSDSIQIADNVDGSHKILLKIYVPDDVLEVRSVKLAFSLENFRTYETGTAGGGGVSTSSGSGGGVSTSSAGGGVVSSAGGGNHSHLMFNVNPAYVSVATIGVQLTSADGDAILEGISSNTAVNTGLYTRGSSGTHAHIGGSHIHQIVLNDHIHQIVLNDHYHNMNFAIYEGSKASLADVFVNGIKVLDNNGAHYNTDQNNLELSSFITNSGWNVVEISSSTLGRINASLYIKSYVAL